MDLLFLRRLTLEPMPLDLTSWTDVQSFKELERAHLVQGELVKLADAEHAVVREVTPAGRALLASKQRASIRPASPMRVGSNQPQ